MAWYLVPAGKAMFRDANAIAPNRKKTSDGSVGDTSHQARPSDHNPDRRSNPPGAVRATDVTHDPPGGWDAHARIRQCIARRDRRIKYVISQRKIISYYPVGSYPAWAERPYGGSNGHFAHAHTSYRTDTANDDSPWWPEAGGDELAGLGEQILAEVQALSAEVAKVNGRVDELEPAIGKLYPGGPSVQKALVKMVPLDPEQPDGPKVPQEHLNIITDMISEALNRIGAMETEIQAIKEKLNEDNG